MQPAPATNLASEASLFIGRSQELDRLQQLFTGGRRLVTLWGAGGIGKTRIATHYGLTHLSDFRCGGTWLCELRGARGGDDLVAQVGAILQVPLLSGQPNAALHRQLGAAIATRGRMLLLLDNLEQIVVSAAEAVETWLARAPELRVLATSRRSLGIPGEALLEIPPMATRSPDNREALQLFLQRASEARPGIALAESSPAVGEIVERTEGIPLAIELAAARLSVADPPQLLKHFDDHLQLLSRPARRSARADTLREAIAWSWALLEPPEQAALAQLAVFDGAFSLEAAEAVLRAERASRECPLDLLQGLRDASLLRLTPSAADSPPRFSLFESVRAFASEKLRASRRAGRARARHAAFYLEGAEAWAARIDGPASAEALAWVAFCRENCLAALAHLAKVAPAGDPVRRLRLALDRFMSFTGPVGAHLKLLDSPPAARSRPRLLDLRIQTARGAAQVAYGQAELGLSNLESALTAARRLREPELEAGVLLEMARAKRALCQFSEALRILRQAQRLSQATGNLGLLASCLTAQAVVHHFQRHLATASRLYEQGIRLARQSENLRSEGSAVASLAFLQQDRGDLAGARRTLERAREIALQLRDRRLEGRVEGYAGNLLREEGQSAEAEERYRAAIRTLQEVGDRSYAVTFLMDLGVLQGLRRELGPARSSLRQARDVAVEIGSHYVAALILGYLSALEIDGGDAASAKESLEAARQQARIAADPSLEQVLAIHRAHLRIAGAPQSARSGRAELDDLVERFAGSSRRSLHVRLAMQLLTAALDELDPPAAALVIHRSGDSVRPPNHKPIDLSARVPLARLVAALVEQRLLRPGEGLSLQALSERVWPAQGIPSHLAANRLRVAVNTLRRKGLDQLIRWQDGGYQLDAGARIVLSGRETAPAQDR